MYQLFSYFIYTIFLNYELSHVDFLIGFLLYLFYPIPQSQFGYDVSYVCFNIHMVTMKNIARL